MRGRGGRGGAAGGAVARGGATGARRAGSSEDTAIRRFTTPSTRESMQQRGGRARVGVRAGPVNGYTVTGVSGRGGRRPLAPKYTPPAGARAGERGLVVDFERAEAQASRAPATPSPAPFPSPAHASGAGRGSGGGVTQGMEVEEGGGGGGAGEARGGRGEGEEAKKKSKWVWKPSPSDARDVALQVLLKRETGGETAFIETLLEEALAKAHILKSTRQ